MALLEELIFHVLPNHLSFLITAYPRIKPATVLQKPILPKDTDTVTFLNCTQLAMYASNI